MKLIPSRTPLLLLTLLACISFSVIADTREDKITQLIEAQGFEDILNAQMAVHRAESERVGLEILNSFLKGIDAPDEFKQGYEAAHQKYLDTVIKPWTAKEVTMVWSKLYGVHFTDKELDELLAFYTSNLALRETEVIKIAVPEYNRYFQVLAKKIFDDALEAYRFELTLLSKRCACEKEV